MDEQEDNFFSYEFISLFNFDWSVFREEEIHKILEYYYDTRGFNVKNMHEADRANEGGADLIVNNKKENIAIAVKIKPKKSDYPQALELSERLESTKIYYSVKTPTNDFIEKTQKIKNVQFKTMKDFLVECFQKNKGVFFELMINNRTTLVRNIELSKFYFIQMFKSKDSDLKPTRKLSRESMQQLWRMKDSAVELNKTTEHLINFYDGHKVCDEKDESRRFLYQILALDKRLKTLPEILRVFYEKNKAFLAYNSKETYLDSDWLYFSMNYNLTPNQVNEYMNSYKKEKNEFRFQFKDEPNGGNLSKHFCVILRHINRFGCALEFRIDNFFKQANGEVFERDKE